MVLKSQKSGDQRSTVSSTAPAAVVVLALLAVTMVAANGQATSMRPGDVRQAMREADPARIVAAAVKAAARDLLGADELQTTATGPACFDATASQTVGLSVRADEDAIPAPRPLAERLLDLPPPTC